MITIASIIERFEQEYLSQYGASILPSHANALGAMKRCRSTLAARMLANCGVRRAACGAPFLWSPQLPALPAP